jgi:phosphoglycolate phosphatase-like HAD superfamily hydrolase
VFFDFDGVIKDSVSVKSDAFELLFDKFGTEVSTGVRTHHEINGGMSRYEKIPLYLSWAGLPITNALVEEYSELFSEIVKQKVIDSKWVAGVEQFIRSNCNKLNMFVVTATPQSEIEEILEALEIHDYFIDVIGAPVKKNDAVRRLIRKYCLNPKQSVLIGDSMPDYQAAVENGVAFVLRATQLNISMRKNLICTFIEDFTHVDEEILK